MNFKFIHAADLHIDSPLRGLGAYDGAPVEQLRSAARQSLRNLVQLAIDQQVDFVVIAGDIFDGDWPDMNTGLWTAAQFRVLHKADIPVYLIRGNHDAASVVLKRLNWPSNVHEFSQYNPQTFVLPKLGVALHGQSFPNRRVDENLAASYPQPIGDTFNIGLLHTSLSGDALHDTYAPVAPGELIAHGYDYWALGHIHQRGEEPISERPYIAFSGNTQGRHVKETGPKGCLLVSVVDREIEDVSFHPLDAVRWWNIEVALQSDDDLPQLYERCRQKLSSVLQESDGRLAAVRLTLRGACAAHDQLRDAASREQADGELRNLAAELGELWLEKIIFALRGAVDLDQLRGGGDLLGELLRTIDQIRNDQDRLQELAAELAPLQEKAPLEIKRAHIELENSNALVEWLSEAERLLVTELSQEGAP